MFLADRQNYHITYAHRLFCLFNILAEYVAQLNLHNETRKNSLKTVIFLWEPSQNEIDDDSQYY